jgi:hypothetical protein
LEHCRVSELALAAPGLGVLFDVTRATLTVA